MKGKIIKGIITILFIITLIFLLRTIDFNLFIKELKSINKFFIIAAVITTILAIMARIFKFKFATNYLSYKINFKDASLFQILSLSFALITPARIGEATKAVLLKKRLNIPITSAVSIVILERLLDLLFLVLASFFYSILLIKNITFSIILIAILITIILIFFLMKKSNILKKFIPTRFKKYLDEPIKFNKSKKILILLIIWTIITWLLDSFTIWLIAKSLNISLSFLIVIGITSISTIATLLSILPWGIGAYDLSIIFLLSLLGITKESATIILIASRLIGIIMPFVLSIILINITGFSFKRSDLKEGNS